MNKQKISIIGAGTAGCLTTSVLLRNPNIEIDWYFDPNSPAQSVGEGTFPFFPQHLQNDWGMDYDKLNILDYTIKKGIRKINWGGSGDFNHNFDLGEAGIHFNASKYQSLIKKLAPFKGVNLIEKFITSSSSLDSTYTIDCSGNPSKYTNYFKAQYIPVNSVHIVQCLWEKPKFDYTLTIARPYGWVFGIPLQGRCSIGYLYNKNINTLEEIQEDIKEIFKQFNLTPSTTTNTFSFNNYYKKENFTDKIAYNGNSSFFLEPLEATSLSLVQNNALLVNDYLNGLINLNLCNESFINFIEQVEGMIMLHYLAGSKFKTSFWEFATSQANLCLSKISKTPQFKEVIKHSLKFNSTPFAVKNLDNPNLAYGSWIPYSFFKNLTNLNIYNHILPLIK